MSPNNSTRIRVGDQAEIAKASEASYVGDVTCPELIGPVEYEAFDQIWVLEKAMH
jgi:hypothetical protein